jgi:hypothetical protein
MSLLLIPGGREEGERDAQTCLAYVLGQALGIGRYVVDDPMYPNHLGWLRIGRVRKTKSSRPPPRRPWNKAGHDRGADVSSPVISNYEVSTAKPIGAARDGQTKIKAGEIDSPLRIDGLTQLVERLLSRAQGVGPLVLRDPALTSAVCLSRPGSIAWFSRQGSYGVALTPILDHTNKM